jgi:hypothetical protein
MPHDCAALAGSFVAKRLEIPPDVATRRENCCSNRRHRLKRARSHCRNGFMTLARQDYVALTDGRYGRRR